MWSLCERPQRLNPDALVLRRRNVDEIKAARRVLKVDKGVSVAYFRVVDKVRSSEVVFNRFYGTGVCVEKYTMASALA
jgi:hypothetical protein